MASSPPSPAPGPEAGKRARILSAAKAVFTARGFNRALISEIAERAGVGKGTVYAYFRSKEDLFFAVFEEFMQQQAAAARVDIAVLGLPSAEKLAALSEAVVGRWDALKDEFTLVMEFWAASSVRDRERFRQAFRSGYEHFRRLVAALLREGIERGEFRRDAAPASVAAALVGAWDALFLQAWFDEGFDLQQAARDFVRVLVRGLSTQSTGT